LENEYLKILLERQLIGLEQQDISISVCRVRQLISGEETEKRLSIVFPN
jgi:hypothetical protein